ncbi:ESX-1 secretion-associated protein EspK [Mycobacterium simulans]|uniref:ESX-1 secretion-associated protein EspK n=1 Tax=Mycobacterium simulans TaxID=627089 RepID=A0A7Z7IQP2_9MYCO|nr:secretion protein EspK [Mycobacterium simulans]SOJ56775.1 ESX-1 secretion-associated protein EspK [Mycobacterium simulans]
MRIPRPMGNYARQMIQPGGWPEADEDTFYDRAQEYHRVLRDVTDVMDAGRRQQVEVFDGGIWSGGAANAANGALDANLSQLSTLQDYLATVITWHRHIAGLIVRAKSEIGDNVDGAQREISILANDPNLDADERAVAIDSLVRATHAANTSLVADTAEEVLASENWKPPHNALAGLLRQVIPPTPDIPSLVVPTPGPPSPAIPNPDVPNPNPGGAPIDRGPVTPVVPTTGTPVVPTPGGPVGPGMPVVPTPGSPATPPSVTPTPAPSPQPGPVPPSPDRPLMPVDPGTPRTPGTPADESAVRVRPAALTDASPAPSHQGTPVSGPAHTDDASASTAPAAANGAPAAARGASAGSGAADASAGTDSAPSGAGSRTASGRAPLGPAGRAPAAPATQTASARTAPPGRARIPERDKRDKDIKKSPGTVTPSPMVPVSAARAARDAIAARTAGTDGGNDPLRLARRIAAALNAPDMGSEGDYGFFWITAVTTDGEIVVANSYGLAYIPDEVQLPNPVHMASADNVIPADEKARFATYPILAVQGWAGYHDLNLRAVIGTAEQLANSDPGAAKIVLEPDDIPHSGNMTGRSRLEVVNPAAAARLAATDDLRLTDLLPPAPVEETPPDDERHKLWFDVMKPMTSTAAGREVAHLRAFQAFAAHCRQLAWHKAYRAADPESRRAAVADWLYWHSVVGLLGSALSAAP